MSVRTEGYIFLGRSFAQTRQCTGFMYVEDVDCKRQEPGREVLRAGLRAHPEQK